MIGSAVPTGTPVSDKVCLCISSVVPPGTPVSDKSSIGRSSVVPTGLLPLISPVSE